MAEKRDVKGAIYKREVWKIPLKEEKICTNKTNLNYDKNILKHKETYLDTYKDLNEVQGKYTEKVVIYKTNTCPIIKEDNDNYTCEICTVECSGIENFKRHIAGKKHTKRLKELNILEEMKSPSERVHATTKIKIEHKKFTDSKESVLFRNKQTIEEIMALKNLGLSDLAIFAENESCTKSSIIYCDACKKHFSNYQVYHHHLLDKSGHFENEKCVKLLRKNITITSEDGSKFSCEMCSKTFTGIVPYKQHLSSSIHIKKDNVDKLQKVRNATLNSEMSCIECDKKFSGIVPFNDHIKGSAHQKLLKKKHLLAKLKNEHSEVFKNTLLKIDGEDIKRVEVFDRVTFSKTKIADSDCHCEIQHGLQKNDYDTQQLNEMLSKEDIQKYLLLHVSDSDDSADDVLIEL